LIYVKRLGAPPGRVNEALRLGRQGDGMRMLVLLPALLLAACTAPVPGMHHAGVVSREVAVDGSRWRVDVDGAAVLAHRLNFDTRIARGPMVMRGAAAIVLATGCPLRRGTLTGDQALVRAETDCGEDTALRVAAPGAEAIACVIAAARPGSRAPEPVVSDCLIDG
jgi:hypothetical protein